MGSQAYILSYRANVDTPQFVKDYIDGRRANGDSVREIFDQAISYFIEHHDDKEPGAEPQRENSVETMKHGDTDPTAEGINASKLDGLLDSIAELQRSSDDTRHLLEEISAKVLPVDDFNSELRDRLDGLSSKLAEIERRFSDDMRSNVTEAEIIEVENLDDASDIVTGEDDEAAATTAPVYETTSSEAEVSENDAPYDTAADYTESEDTDVLDDTVGEAEDAQVYGENEHEDASVFLEDEIANIRSWQDKANRDIDQAMAEFEKMFATTKQHIDEGASRFENMEWAVQLDTFSKTQEQDYMEPEVEDSDEADIDTEIPEPADANVYDAKESDIVDSHDSQLSEDKEQTEDESDADNDAAQESSDTLDDGDIEFFLDLITDSDDSASTDSHEESGAWKHVPNGRFTVPKI